VYVPMPTMSNNLINVMWALQSWVINVMCQ
jgi:hypothetical protein